MLDLQLPPRKNPQPILNLAVLQPFNGIPPMCMEDLVANAVIHCLATRPAMAQLLNTCTPQVRDEVIEDIATVVRQIISDDTGFVQGEAEFDANAFFKEMG